MRIGKFVEHFQAAAKAAQIGDPILRATAFGRQIGYGLYLVHDSLIWVRRSRLAVVLSRTSCTAPRSRSSSQTRSRASTSARRSSG